MSEKKYVSVYELEGRALEAFLEKYGDIYEPRYIDFDYYKMYYLGKYDPLGHIFSYVASMYPIKKVFYPGSFIHITPSFYFQDVTYVDIYDGIKSFFSHPDVLKYIALHKIYEDQPKVTFLHESYLTSVGRYDLLISSNAGSISIDCKKCLNTGGYLLVNNGYSDADNAFADKDYEYIGYFKFNINKDRISLVMDDTSKKSNDFYLFKKVG